jgi:hypothetical protein
MAKRKQTKGQTTIYKKAHKTKEYYTNMSIWQKDELSLK